MTQEQRSLTLHKSSVVVDMHSDANLDVIRSRGQGERRVLERRHLPRWKEGGINVVVLNTLPKFGPDPYPYCTTPVRNALLLMDAVHQELSESPDYFRLVIEPDDIRKAQDEDRIGIILGIEGAGHVGMGPDYADHAHDIIIAARRVAGPNQPVNDVTIPYARGLEHTDMMTRQYAGSWEKASLPCSERCEEMHSRSPLSARWWSLR